MVCGLRFKMIFDVVRLVISYVEPRLLVSFFVGNGLDLRLKFNFDMRGWNLRANELCKICEIFPGLVLKGANVRFKARDRMRWLRVANLKGYTESQHVMKNLASCGNYLQSLDLSGCPWLTDIGALCFCRGLRGLNLSGCWRVSNFDILGSLKMLERLELKDMKYWVNRDVEMIGGFEKLRYLDLEGCKCVNNIGFLRGCLELRYVDLSYLKMKDLRELGKLGELRSVKLIGCSEVIDLRPLVGCKKLRELDVSGCCKLIDVSCLFSLEHGNLKRLSLGGTMVRGRVGTVSLKRLCCPVGIDVALLGSCGNLRSLGLVGGMGGMGGMEGRVEGIECISFLKRLKSLTLLRVDLGDLPSCEWLEELSLEECSNMSRIGMMLSGLKILYVENNKDIGWDALSNCKELHTIVLKNCNGLDKWENLWKCSKLRTLKAVRCYIPKEFFKGCEIKDLEIDFSYGRFEAFTEWEGRVGLERVKLFRCHLRIGMLVGCVKLREIDLNDWRDVIDVSVLANCPNLEIIRAINCCHLRGYEILERKGVSVVRI